MDGGERFRRTMHCQSVDREPMSEVGFWDEMRRRWLRDSLSTQMTIVKQ